MTVKVVTDSTSDIPQELAEELDIAVVPIYVRFNEITYRDGVDINAEEFYRMLDRSPYHPASSQPNPEDIETVYGDYCEDTEGIVSIHISSKISGTYNSANIAKRNMEMRCPIEVVDSGFNSSGLALVTLAAARLAQAGKSFDDVLRGVQTAIRQTDMFGMFGTMKYLARSGRVNRAISTVADVLNVMPLLTFREGEIVRAGLVRSIAKGTDRLFRFVAEKRNLAEVIIAHSQIPDRAEEFRQRVEKLFPAAAIRVMEMGAGLGVHGGPGMLIIGVRTADEGNG